MEAKKLKCCLYRSKTDLKKKTTHLFNEQRRKKATQAVYHI